MRDIFGSGEIGRLGRVKGLGSDFSVRGLQSVLMRSPVWTPAEITTALWLDAADADTITLTSGKVSEWRDKSGNSRHASQTTTTNQPTYQSAGFNDLPTISFDGSNDQLNLVQFAQVSGQNIFAVIDTTNVGSDWRNFMNRTSASASNMAILLSGAGVNYRPCLYWNNTARSVWGAAVQRKAIIRWSFATGSPASALTQVDDATAVSETFTASELTNWESICTAAFQQCNIKLSELIMTPATPDADYLAKLQGYFAHKWDLTANLTIGHPYKSSAPTI